MALKPVSIGVRAAQMWSISMAATELTTPDPSGPGSRPTHRVSRRLLILIAVMVLVGLVGYTGFVGTAGAENFIHPKTSRDCLTPMDQFGWAYEAVNYDIRDDDKLKPAEHREGGRRTFVCPSQGAKAGDEIVTEDGTRIAGWYIPAADGNGPDGPTVLLVHGRSANKSEFLGYGVPLHRAFNLLLIDLRNGGQSTGDETTLGFRERQDVAASVDWLARTKHPTWIAGVGTSMGAAALLAAAVDDTRIRALVLDSMHATAVDLWASAISSETGHPPFPTGWATVTFASLRLGLDVSAVDPIRMIGRLGDRPVLLTHGTKDPYNPPAQSADRNFKAAQDADVPVELRYCEGAGHAQVVVKCPREWREWVTTFLDPASPGFVRERWCRSRESNPDEVALNGV